jgi:hypothetical protein
MNTRYHVIIFCFFCIPPEYIIPVPRSSMMKESVEKNGKIIEVAKTDELPVGKIKHVE